MNTHQRQIDRSLYPTQHAFDIVLIGVLVARTEESTSVVGPPRNTSSLNTQTCHDLATEGLPIVAHIATPESRTIALNAWESATCENHGLTTSSYQSFINGFVNQQGIDITHLLTTPTPIVDTTPHKVVVLWFCSILPPSINTQRQQALAEVLPIRRCSLRIEEINPVSSRNIILVAHHLAPHVRVLVNLRPNAEHQSYIHLVQTIRQGLGVWIVSLVELHRVPTILAPILPILHDEADGHILLAKAIGCLEDFL